MQVGFIISHLRLCLRADCDVVVALSGFRATTEENKYCEVPGPRERLSEGAHPQCIKEVCGSWAIFLLGLDVSILGPHVVRPCVASCLSKETRVNNQRIYAQRYILYTYTLISGCFIKWPFFS